MNYKLRRLWKGIGRSLLKILSNNVTGGTEDNMKDLGQQSWRFAEIQISYLKSMKQKRNCTEILQEM